ncbi:MAG: bifunctional 5,10-methylenetetrahydrofolate dehydrogenase/5,10-methenyltetrahydrofolate cyclohydrolase [Candidatus Azambacteria bacterium]|nr:bifunctional 5,10-methylenetetrahydrofolate dehydrogenase/5,10-methenyltetrahydrofolate cyclohydrolase [Candidatus Azambacteria bacterium]
MILSSASFVRSVKNGIIKKVERAHSVPMLAIVLVGKNPASLSYVKKKGQVAESLGCRYELHCLPQTASQARILALIAQLNASPEVTGIIVQLPLPEKHDVDTIISAIAPHKDVDNLRGDSPFIAPSVQAIWHILLKAGAPRKDTPILIIGYGTLIGKPLHAFLMKKGFTRLTVADKKTKNLDILTQKADVVISATGKPNLVTRVKRGAIVIDAGSGFYKGKIKGDADTAAVALLAKIVTPVPGGVGPLTVAYLFRNLLLALK